MIYYVCGFVFDEQPSYGYQSSNVLLIRKNRPEWQRGLLNGIGGKIEGDEGPHAAMSREFREEAGVSTKPIMWTSFCIMKDPTYRVEFFYLRNQAVFDEARSMEDEELVRASISLLLTSPTVFNLRWLIPLALDPHAANRFTVDVLNEGGN